MHACFSYKEDSRLRKFFLTFSEHPAADYFQGKIYGLVKLIFFFLNPASV